MVDSVFYTQPLHPINTQHSATAGDNLIFIDTLVTLFRIFANLITLNVHPKHWYISDLLPIPAQPTLHHNTVGQTRAIAVIL